MTNSSIPRAKFSGSAIPHNLAGRYRMDDGVWVLKSGVKDFAYSDGDEAETRIFDILKKTKNKSIFSDKLPYAITDWASLYYFGPARANLLYGTLAGEDVRAGTHIHRCGAHHGFFSLLATSCRPHLRVIAGEPVRQNLQALMRNVQ